MGIIVKGNVGPIGGPGLGLPLVDDPVMAKFKDDSGNVNGMTIDQKIDLLGNTFRGLWRSVIMWEDSDRKEPRWTVTFQHKDEFVETDGFMNAHEALDSAIAILK